MGETTIKLYTLSTCSHCKNAKKLLNSHDVKYEMFELDTCPPDQRNKLIDEVKLYNPACSFPTLVVGDKVIVGYREQEIKELLGL